MMGANERLGGRSASWVAEVDAWTRAVTDSADHQARLAFPVAEVLAAWRSVGREAAEPAWASTIDGALRAVRAASPDAAVGRESISWQLLESWLPMLVDVHHARCRYATYVGTNILQHAEEGDTGDEAASEDVMRILLAQLLDFELGAAAGVRQPRHEPPRGDLSERRAVAIMAALRPWVSEAGQGLGPREVADTIMRRCPAKLRLALDCALVPITMVHDEVLFIRVLQVFETVFLRVHGLLEAGRDRLVDGDLAEAGRSFSRAAAVMDRAYPVFRVLATIRPDSFATIRQKTTGASGLQSVAFKRIELLAATPNPARAASEAFESEEVASHLGTERPSIEAVLSRSRSARVDPLVLAGLAEMDRAWLRWKRAHWAVAAHVIGSSPGTGGTSGVSYLRTWMTDPLIPRLPAPPSVSGSHVSLAAQVRDSPMACHLRQQVLATVGDGSQPDVVALPAARWGVGEFRVDLRGVGGRSDEIDGSTCGTAAEALALRDGVEDAVPIPPSVYVTPSLETLHDVVLGAVSAEGTRYGSDTSVGGAAVQVQYGCPNLNKALHVGHLRNIFLGSALANIIEAAGHRVVRVDQPSNRGRHIAQAVLAYEPWSGTGTPVDRGEKPDHFVQRLYSDFAERRRVAGSSALEQQLARTVALLDGGDARTVAVAEKLTRWAYQGIQQTYDRLGERFDAVFAEGDTLGLAADSIRSRSDVVRRRPDKSVFIDLSERGLREVTLLRRDGSPLLHAQFLGACLRREQLDPDTKLLFVMGDEYRHTVPELLGTLELLGSEELAAGIEAVHHGMVTIAGHKVSSRAGDAPTADSLLDHMRDRLTLEWEQDVGTGLGFHERHVCEQLAIAMVRLELLSTRRDRPVELDVEWVWESAPKRIARIVACLDRTPVAQSGGRRARPLLLHLDQFGRHIADAVHRRDPFVLVRYLDELCRLGSRAATTDGDQRLAPACGTVTRRVVDLLGIRLPPFASLPPGFRAIDG